MNRRLMESIERISGYLDTGHPLVALQIGAAGVLPDKDRITAIAAMKCTREGHLFHVVDKCDLRIAPGPDAKLQEKAAGDPGENGGNEKTEKKDMRKGIPEQEAFQRLHDLLGDEPILIGEKLKRFQIPLLKRTYDRHQSALNIKEGIDILELVEECIPGMLKEYTLTGITDVYRLGEGIDLNTPMGKVIALVRILNTLYSHAENEAEEELNEMELDRELSRPASVGVVVVGTDYWEKNGRKRIYIRTEPPVEAYYDITKHSWFCGEPGVDLEKLKKDVLTNTHG